jgi:hypothetical protein
MGAMALIGYKGDECHSGGWRKSSYSLTAGHCVEVANLPGGKAAGLAEGRVGVRDSVQGAAGAVLGFDRKAFAAFIARIRTLPAS